MTGLVAGTPAERIFSSRPGSRDDRPADLGDHRHFPDEIRREVRAIGAALWQIKADVGEAVASLLAKAPAPTPVYGAS